jgi:hypothetical protein
MGTSARSVRSRPEQFTKQCTIALVHSVHNRTALVVAGSTIERGATTAA